MTETEQKQLSLLCPGDFSDSANAALFAEQMKNRVRWCDATGWLVWNGVKWEANEHLATECAIDFSERMLQEAVRVYKNSIQIVDGKTDIPDKVRSFLKHAERTRSRNSIDNFMSLAKAFLNISADRLDADGFLLNTPDGTINLRDGKMKAHDPNDYCTKITAVSPGTENAEIFTVFLERLTVGDRELERFLQEIAGMCAVGKVFQENLIICSGSGGNGKSSHWNTLSRVLGDYSGALSAETLTANCRKNKSPEYAELRGKRLVIASELEEGMRLDTAIVKKLCSTDPVLGEAKYKAPFSFIPSHTVVLYTNFLPQISATDGGTWSRIVILPFLANFRGMEGEIKNYGEFLYQNCASAVMAWIVEGARQFIANGYITKQPECVVRAIEQYKQDNDLISNFLNERCTTGPTCKTRTSKIYMEYQDYCVQYGERPKRCRDFAKEMETAGFRRVTIRGKPYFCGVQPDYHSDRGALTAQQYG